MTSKLSVTIPRSFFLTFDEFYGQLIVLCAEHMRHLKSGYDRASWGLINRLSARWRSQTAGGLISTMLHGRRLMQSSDCHQTTKDMLVQTRRPASSKFEFRLRFMVGGMAIGGAPRDSTLHGVKHLKIQELLVSVMSVCFS